MRDFSLLLGLRSGDERYNSFNIKSPHFCFGDAQLFIPFSDYVLVMSVVQFHYFHTFSF